jgi:hypothetical protein
VLAGLDIALVDGLVPWAKLGDLKVLPFQPRSALDIVLVTSTTLPQSRFGREFTRDIQAAIHDLGRARPTHAAGGIPHLIDGGLIESLLPENGEKLFAVLTRKVIRSRPR